MGKIVAAYATVHAPQLFDRPPSEDPKQLDADIAAMRQIGKELEETKPDAVIVIGSDHLETFFLSSVPTFAILSGEYSHAEFAGRKYELKIHEALTEDLLDKLNESGFRPGLLAGRGARARVRGSLRMGDREAPHSRRSDFRERVSPAPAYSQRCAELGKAIAKIIAERPEKVAIVASGGMSHFPGTWKYPKPDFDFDYWAISQMEKGNHQALINLTNEQLDEVGNTEMLSWMIMFGAIGNQPGELVTYQPTWHHGHAVMRFMPLKGTGPSKEGAEAAKKYEFKGGYEFYKHPSPAAYKLNKVLYDSRFKRELRLRLVHDLPSVAKEYGMTPEEAKVLETLQDDDIEKFRDGQVHPLVEAGAHPLGMWMAVIRMHAELRKLRAAKSEVEKAGAA